MIETLERKIHKAKGPLPQAFREEDLIASVCRSSYYEFVKEFWSEIINEPPHWNWHIKYLCDVLQEMAERVFLSQPKLWDLLINISPGTTKSTVCTVMFQPWTWTRMPSARHIVGTHTEELAHRLSRLARDIVRSEKYRACFPEVEIRADQDTKGYWANTRGGDRFTCTVGGRTPMGVHAHFIWVDDPLDPEKALSSAEVESANRWMSGTLPSRKVDKRVTPTGLVMQRVGQADPSGEWLEKKKDGLRRICLPAEITSNVYPKELAANYIDGLMDPIRLSREVLNEAKQEGDYYYSGQYLQDPVPLGGGMFKTKFIHIEDQVPDIKSFRRLVRYWDKAGTLAGGAFSVGVLMGERLELGHKQFWILDVVRGQWDSHTRERYVWDTANSDGKKVEIGIEQEPGSGGKESAENTVRRLAGWRVRINKPGAAEGGKALRADPLSVQVNGGNVYMKKAHWNHVFLEEMRYFPHSRYKDQIDAASGAFTLITKGRQIVGAWI